MVSRHDTVLVYGHIRNMDMVAIGRVVITSREHIIALGPLDKGLNGDAAAPPLRGAG